MSEPATTIPLQPGAHGRRRLVVVADGLLDGLLDWQAALDASILDVIGSGRRAETKERLLACLSSS